MRWMVLILGLFLSGCYAHYQARYQYQGPPPLQTTSMSQVDSMVGAQQPVAYKVGFMEGCDSGRLSSGNSSFLYKKDMERFGKDDAYKQGWNDGFNRCASGEGVPSGNYYYQREYGYYYPSTVYTGFYYPSYYYAPGYSVWLGYYGYPRHYRYIHRHNHYYSHWNGGHKHRGGYRGKPYRGKYNITKSRPGGGKKYKGGGYKGGGGGYKGGRYKIR
jgi:hypothetical protein